jgi:O-antigen/teichoic acid export membrane protein
MSLVKRNVIANLLGGALLAGLTVVITPLQVNILGLEAYGVVGFITTLQIAFTAFDLGLSSTLTRELAADPSARKQGSTGLLRTASTIYWCTAVVIGLVIAVLAEPMAKRWFNTTTLDPTLLAQSLQVIALYLALRWPVSLYVGVLMGLQRMDVLNAVKVATAALRLIGGMAVLLQWRSLYAFLLWTALNALIEVAAFWLACHRVHPTMPVRPGISWPALQRVWRFSLSMNGLAILTVLIVQIDRLLISKMLTLKALGAYTLAYNTAAVVPALIGAIASAVLPSFAAACGQGSQETLRRRYNDASRVMLYVIGMAVAVLVFFGEPLLAVWINPTAAAAAAWPLALLAIGFWGSAAVSNAFQVAIAAGRPNLALRISVLTAPPYFLALYGLILYLGIDGAALAWLLLNASYLLLLVPRVHREVLEVAVSPFVLRILAPFMLLGVLTFGLARAFVDGSGFATPAGLAAFGGALLLYGAAGLFLLGNDIRRSMWSTLRLKAQAS